MIPVLIAGAVGGFTLGYGCGQWLQARESREKAERLREERRAAAEREERAARAYLRDRAKTGAKAVQRERARRAQVRELALNEAYADLARLQRQARRAPAASVTFLRLRQEIAAQRRLIRDLERRQ